MSQTEPPYESSLFGALYGVIGIVLIAIGLYALANANEAAAFGPIGVALVGGGSYALIAGAVARGIQLARK